MDYYAITYTYKHVGIKYETVFTRHDDGQRERKGRTRKIKGDSSTSCASYRLFGPTLLSLQGW